MTILVKICGINSLEAADAALASNADFCGLAFHSGSPRNLAPEAARAIAARMRGRTQIVAFLSDPTDDRLAEVVQLAQPDLLQLHGNETPSRVAEIRDRFRLPVIRAIAVATSEDVMQASAYEPVADMLLFDARAPESSLRSGGHGQAFDWQLLKGKRFARPWFLAGGLTAENVARAVATSGARGVDVSSGVEIAPGIKSPEQISRFISSARAAEQPAAFSP